MLLLLFLRATMLSVLVADGAVSLFVPFILPLFLQVLCGFREALVSARVIVA